MRTCLTSVNIAQNKEGHSETFSHKAVHLDQLMYSYEWSAGMVLYILVRGVEDINKQDMTQQRLAHMLSLWASVYMNEQF